MRLRSSDKPTVTSSGYQDIQINIWGDRYGPRPKPVGLVLLIILVVIALGGIYPAYYFEAEAVDETEGLQNELDGLEVKIEALSRPPEEEKEIKIIEDQIAVLKSDRKAINQGYGYFAATIKAIDDSFTQASSFESVNLKGKAISIQGNTDEPTTLFELAEKMKNQIEFADAQITKISDVTDIGRVDELSNMKGGATEVSLAVKAKNIASTPQEMGEFVDNLIEKDPSEDTSGHDENVTVTGPTIGKDLFWGSTGTATIELTMNVVSGNMKEPPVTVLFDTIIGSHYPMTSYEWVFGDDTTHEVALPQPGPKSLPLSILHTFTKEGAISAKLTVYDSSGYSVAATKGGRFSSADVDFSASLVSCDKPKTIKFKPSVISSDRITSYEWNFEGETETVGQEDILKVDSTKEEPVHTFSEAEKTYTVTLTVSGDMGKPISKDHDVLVSGTPTANFYPERIGGDGEFTVRFADASMPDGKNNINGEPNEIIQWKWDFGDAISTNITNSGSKNPIHTYSSDGPYTVTLQVWETDANCTTISKTIKGVDSNSDAFFIEPGKKNLEISFASPIAKKDNTAFLWDFGDGFTSNQENTTHTYRYSGNYPVTLRVEEQIKDTRSEVASIVTFVSADVNVIGSTSTSFQLVVLPGSLPQHYEGN